MEFIRLKAHIGYAWRSSWIILIYNVRVLPTRIGLQDKGVWCPTNCVSCEHQAEDIGHVCFHCPFAVQVRNSAGLWQQVQYAVHSTAIATEAIFSLLQNLQPDFRYLGSYNLEYLFGSIAT